MRPRHMAVRMALLTVLYALCRWRCARLSISPPTSSARRSRSSAWEYGVRSEPVSDVTGSCTACPIPTQGIAVSLLFLGKARHRIVQEYVAAHAAHAAGSATLRCRPPRSRSAHCDDIFILASYYLYFTACCCKSKHLKTDDMRSLRPLLLKCEEKHACHQPAPISSVLWLPANLQFQPWSNP